MDQSTTRAFQKILLSHSFSEAQTKAEGFAQKRYLKKMELPDEAREDIRSARCWDDFIGFDHALPSSFRPTGRWYRVRQFLHGIMADFSFGDVTITNGSEFDPTSGHNSIEAKLASSSWSCTRTNRDLAIQMIRSHRALTRAFKRRYHRAVGENSKAADKWLWARSKRAVTDWGNPKAALRERVNWTWLAKSELVFSYEEGSRFSTVRKNNEKNRPINIECLLNMLVQRRIGNGLRKLIREVFGVDLDHASDLHRIMIACDQVATIDLQNASDSVLMKFVEFLFPKWFVDYIQQSRSHFILGPDGDYHNLNKVSAMGNGFTFELMTLILLALVRSYDPQGSVFGDDIICKNDVAEAVVGDLVSVGFVVNKEKSFIHSTFRESCGANFYDDEGYVRSFDFEYPNNIVECAHIYNKCAALATSYPSFEELRCRLFRAIPTALRGGSLPSWHFTNAVPSIEIPNYFACEVGRRINDDGLLSWVRESYHLGEEKFFTFKGWSYCPALRSKTRVTLSESRNWAKYLMYLHSGRITDDIIRDTGSWHSVTFISCGSSTWRKKSLRKAHKAWLTDASGTLHSVPSS